MRRALESILAKLRHQHTKAMELTKSPNDAVVDKYETIASELSDACKSLEEALEAFDREYF